MIIIIIIMMMILIMHVIIIIIIIIIIIVNLYCTDINLTFSVAHYHVQENITI